MSCDTEEVVEAKPWDGRNVYLMKYGGSAIPRNIIYNSDEGDVWWFYFPADVNATYKIAMSYNYNPLDRDMYYKFYKHDTKIAPRVAIVKMTCYKEDGTMIGDISNDGIWEVDMTYYSLLKQDIYVSFEFLSYGYLTFYWNEL